MEIFALLVVMVTLFLGAAAVLSFLFGEPHRPPGPPRDYYPPRRPRRRRRRQSYSYNHFDNGPYTDYFDEMDRPVYHSNYPYL